MTVDLDKEDEQQMQFFVVTMAIQSFKKKNKPLFTCFVDFTKAFDSVKHQAPVTLGKKLASMGVSLKMMNILQSMYANATSRVVANNKFSFSLPKRSKTRMQSQPTCI